MIEVVHCSFGPGKVYHDTLHLMVADAQGKQFIVSLDNVNPDNTHDEIVTKAILSMFGIDLFYPEFTTTRICDLSPEEVGEIGKRSDQKTVQRLKKQFPTLF